MLRSLSLRARLALGCGIAVLMVVALASFAAYRMHALSAQLDLLVSDRMDKLQKYSQLKYNLYEVSKLARNVLIATDPQFRDDQRARIPQIGKQNTVLLDALAKTTSDPKEQAAMQVFLENRSPFKTRLHEAIKLSEAGDRDAASKMLLTGVEEIGQRVFTVVDDSMEHQRSLAVQTAVDARAASDHATSVFVTLAGSVAVLGSLMTWMLLRFLGRTLGAEPAVLGDFARRVASGDLTPVQGASPAPEGSIFKSLVEMQSSLAHIVQQVRESSLNIASATSQLVAGNLDLKARTEAHHVEIDSTVDSLREITGMVTQNAQAAQNANALAQTVSMAADKGSSAMDDVTRTMTAISTDSQRVGDIVGVIESIAFQTNLLALNAAVEAARAGEQGRGFAVVAGEVRQLANRSSNAAREIKQLADASNRQVHQGHELARGAHGSIGEMVSQVNSMSGLVSGIWETTFAQSSGINLLSETVDVLAQAAQSNVTLVTQISDLAGGLDVQASALAESVRRFRLECA